MSGSINIAIIGSGIFVKEQHIPAVLACPDLRLKALYSRSLASAEQAALKLPADLSVDLYADDSAPTHNLAALLSRPDISAVIIALPIPVQPSIIRLALQAGKHVLAEKPIAADIATATALLDWYRGTLSTLPITTSLAGSHSGPPTFAVAEQFRFFSAFTHAAARARSLGRVLNARHRFGAFVRPGSKYFETTWRKTPEYQGGFLLDGGVHFIAGLRLLLGEEAAVKTVSAVTAQLQAHLPPVDTVDAVLRLRGGGTGTFAVSFGTTFEGAEWSVACEGGWVKVVRDTVTVKVVGGEEESVEMKDEGGGVRQEVLAWAKALLDGVPDARQSPEQALADLEFLEAMLKSGENDSASVTLQYQM